MRTWQLLEMGLVAVMICGCARADAAKAPSWSLIPQPASLAPAGHGAVTVAAGDRVAIQADGDAQMQAMAERFIARLAKTRGLALDLAKAGGQARIVFKLDPQADIKDKAGYHIHVGDDRIMATARTPRGLFYASITVGQLLTPDAARGTVQVAGGDIVDHPRFAWRGFMLDSVRHFQSVADIKKIIDWMALHKLDVLHWHLTDDQGW